VDATNEKEFKVEIISREEQSGTMLVRGDLQGYVGGCASIAEVWARLADPMAAFARLAPKPPAEGARRRRPWAFSHQAHRSMKSVQMD